jgi:hypothetical protein
MSGLKFSTTRPGTVKQNPMKFLRIFAEIPLQNFGQNCRNLEWNARYIPRKSGGKVTR